MLTCIPVRNVDPIAETLRQAERDLKAGKLAALTLLTVSTDGECLSGSCAESGTVIAKMLEMLNEHFTCQCNEPGCQTDETHAQLAAILTAYINHDPAAPRFKN